MEECLAIKPDLVFLWDEAWWGFAYFHYLLRVRTGRSLCLVLQSQAPVQQH
jgi:arginine decarboxylase